MVGTSSGGGGVVKDGQRRGRGRPKGSLNKKKTNNTQPRNSVSSSTNRNPNANDKNLKTSKVDINSDPLELNATNSDQSEWDSGEEIASIEDCDIGEFVFENEPTSPFTVNNLIVEALANNTSAKTKVKLGCENAVAVETQNPCVDNCPPSARCIVEAQNQPSSSQKRLETIMIPPKENNSQLETLKQPEITSNIHRKIVNPTLDVHSRPQNSTNSWANRTKPSQKGMTLSYIPPENGVITLEFDEMQSEIEYWSTTLVGNFYGAKPNLKSVESYVTRNWNSVQKPEVLYYKKGWYFFKFANEEDKLKIFRGGPWSWGNSVLILKEWAPNFDVSLNTMTHLPIWVLFPGLDPSFWNFKHLSKLASGLGKPLHADTYTTNKAKLEFARVLVEIDISLDLQYSLIVSTPFGPKEVEVYYEWIPPFCTSCKIIGHDVSKCKKHKPQKHNTSNKWTPKTNQNPPKEPELVGRIDVENDPIGAASKMVVLAKSVEKAAEIQPIEDDGFIMPRSSSKRTVLLQKQPVPCQNANPFNVLLSDISSDDLVENEINKECNTDFHSKLNSGQVANSFPELEKPACDLSSNLVTGCQVAQISTQITAQTDRQPAAHFGQPSHIDSKQVLSHVGASVATQVMVEGGGTPRSVQC